MHIVEEIFACTLQLYLEVKRRTCHLFIPMMKSVWWHVVMWYFYQLWISTCDFMLCLCWHDQYYVMSMLTWSMLCYVYVDMINTMLCLCWHDQYYAMSMLTWSMLCYVCWHDQYYVMVCNVYITGIIALFPIHHNIWSYWVVRCNSYRNNSHQYYNYS
jgi:hypothetical protein